MNQLVVKKFGGAGLATADKVKQVAQHLNHCRREGASVLAVVSAMGKTTDDLVKKAYTISHSPDRRELDMLLSTGERMSMALLCMALKDLDCDAISFTGSQAGVLTDGSHSEARIKNIKPFRVEEELQRGRVVVLAGFQGVNPDTKEITTLGRGGSDTTAVAMAAHFQSARCEIIKEVPGVCSADPRLIYDSKVLPKLDYKSLSHMCYWGAKVLHYRSVELAQRLNVPLLVTSLEDNQQTWIKDEVNMYEDHVALSVNSHEQILHIRSKVKSVREVLQNLRDLLQQNKWPMPTLLESSVHKTGTDLWITGEAENLRLLQNSLKNHRSLSIDGENISSVTLTCYGGPSSELIGKSLELLEEVSIEIHKMIQDSSGFTFFIPKKSRETAVKVMHGLVS